MSFVHFKNDRHTSLTRTVMLSVFISMTCISVYCQAAGKAPLTSVRFFPAGHPSSAVAVQWTKHADHDGLLDVPLEAEFSEITSGLASYPLILAVESASPSTQISVRQRSVSYLNIGEEGPHVSVPGSEQRGQWKPLPAASPGSFRVRATEEQVIPMRYRQYAKSLGNDQRWTPLMRKCRAANEGACYIVTDQEFEVVAVTRQGVRTRKIIRVTNPNGC